jgi:hypothetical protein
MRQAVYRVEYLRNGNSLGYFSKKPNNIFTLQIAVNNKA